MSAGTNVATLRVGGSIAAITPQSFEDVQRLAGMAVTSGLFKGGKDDEREAKLAKATMCIMMGMDVGVPPMQALQGMAVINGKIVIYGDLLTAILWSKGCKIEQSIVGSDDARTATATITRPDGTKITRSFSVKDAKAARLWDDRPTIKKQWNGKWEEKPNDAAWFRFPDRMIGWRALGFAIKDGASDFTRGMEIREDVENDRMVDITPQPQKRLAIADIPDIGDAPAALPAPTEAEASQDGTQDGILSDLEAKLMDVSTLQQIKDIEAEYASVIPSFDDDGRASAIDMIEAAKAGLEAAREGQ